MPTTDFDKEYVLTGNRGQLNSVKIPDLQYTAFGKLIIYRLLNNRDMKMLITGKGKTTGTGKTTLAIHIARFVNAVRNEIFDLDREWSAEDYSFMDVWEYLQRYQNSVKGDCLITDELEYMTDARRWMTDTNVKFSQAWSILRYKNVVTIGTAPGLSDLEKRVKETADIWIRVIKPGLAYVYYMTYDDFDEKYVSRRLRQGGFTERLHWSPLDDDPDYQWLSAQKEELGVPGMGDGEKGKQLTQEDMNEQMRKIRNTAAKDALTMFYNRGVLYPDGEVRIGDIADIVGVSQPQVSRLKNQLKKDGELPQEA